MNIFNRRKFLILSDVPISKGEAMKIQGKDLPISHHDFFGFKCVSRNDGRFETSWYCIVTNLLDKVA